MKKPYCTYCNYLKDWVHCENKGRLKNPVWNWTWVMTIVKFLCFFINIGIERNDDGKVCSLTTILFLQKCVKTISMIIWEHMKPSYSVHLDAWYRDKPLNSHHQQLPCQPPLPWSSWPPSSPASQRRRPADPGPGGVQTTPASPRRRWGLSVNMWTPLTFHSKVCDWKPDCPDESDEEKEGVCRVDSDDKCPDFMFTCGPVSGACISKVNFVMDKNKNFEHCFVSRN